MSDSENGRVYRELGAFFRVHWVHIVLSPVLGFIFCSALHESAHGAAVWIQGGEIHEFRCWPSKGYLGYISYDFPSGAAYSKTAISAAPFILSLVIALMAFLVAFIFRSVPFWFGSSLFVWGWIASFGNIGIGVAGYLRGNRRGDLFKVFGEASVGPASMLLATMAVGCVLGYFIQRRLYGQGALTVRAYGLLVLLILFGISGAAMIGRMI